MSQDGVKILDVGLSAELLAIQDMQSGAKMHFGSVTDAILASDGQKTVFQLCLPERVISAKKIYQISKFMNLGYGLFYMWYHCFPWLLICLHSAAHPRRRRVGGATGGATGRSPRSLGRREPSAAPPTQPRGRQPMVSIVIVL